MVNTTFHGTSHAHQYPVLSATLINVLNLLPHQLYAQSCLVFNLNNRRAKSFRRVTETAAPVFAHNQYTVMTQSIFCQSDKSILVCHVSHEPFILIRQHEVYSISYFPLLRTLLWLSGTKQIYRTHCTIFFTLSFLTIWWQVSLNRRPQGCNTNLNKENTYYKLFIMISSCWCFRFLLRVYKTAPGCKCSALLSKKTKMMSRQRWRIYSDKFV